MRKHRSHSVPHFDISDMSQQEVLDLARGIIGMITLIAFIWISIGVLICNGIFVCLINTVKHHQEQLEGIFMNQGPTHHSAYIPGTLHAPTIPMQSSNVMN